MIMEQLAALAMRYEREEERIAERLASADLGSHLWTCDVRSYELWQALKKAGKVENNRINGATYSQWHRGHKRERFTLAAKSRRQLCGAKCRSGQSCKARVCVRADGTLANRCRMHGGLSTGPKSPRSKFTPELRRAFCRHIIETGRFVDSAKAIGISYKTISRWSNSDQQFKAMVNLAWRLHWAQRPDGGYGYMERARLIVAGRECGIYPPSQ